MMLQKIPIFRHLLALMCGIWLQWAFGLSWMSVSIISLSCICIYAVFRLLPLYVKQIWRWLPGISFFGIFMVVGALLTRVEDVRNNPSWFGNLPKYDSAEVIITEPIVAKNETFAARVNVQKVFSTFGKTAPAKGKLLLYLAKDSLSSHLKYGDVLRIPAAWQQISSNGHPGGFDYAQYAARQQLYFQSYVRTGQYRLIAHDGGNIVWAQIYQAQSFIIKVLHKYMHGARAVAVAEALLVGLRQDMDEELTNAYTQMGVIHVIAISGGHLALLFCILEFIFRPFRRYRKISWFTDSLILLVMWLFSMLVGLGPSMLRAAVMITFVLVGKIFSKELNILNSLVLSAFVLLCCYPLWLYDAGFWLSYTAVLGIVLYQQPIYKMLYINNLFLRNIWQLTSVTLSAQVLTLPVLLFVFHQFPLLFLVTNLFVVPLTSLILSGEILLVMVTWIPFLGKIIGAVLQKMLDVLNALILHLNQLPISVIDGIPFVFAQMVVLFVGIVALSYFLLSRKKEKKYMWCSLVSLLVIALIHTGTYWNDYRTEKLIVYQMARHSAVDLISGNHCYAYSDSSLKQNQALIRKNIAPTRMYFHAAGQNAGILPAVFTCQGKRIWIANLEKKHSPKDSAHLDIIILNENTFSQLPQWLAKYPLSTFVIDASVPLWKIESWKKGCKTLPLRFHSVMQSGAFVLQ